MFINSSEIDNINGVECLHLYLKDEFSFSVKINDEEVLQNEIYIKAPTMSNEDISNIRKCASVLSKFEEIQNEKTLKELSKLSDQERQKLFADFENLQENNEEDIKTEEVIKDHIRSVLKNAKSYETKETDYFSEFDKIINFLEKRLNRNLDSQLYPINFSIFDKYLATKHFIIEEIFVEYVSFFFKHFPLESLLALAKK